MPPSFEVSSAEDVEKGAPKLPISAKSTATGEVSGPINPEYERYLELHSKLDAAGRKKLMRKCLSPKLLLRDVSAAYNG